MNIVFVDIMHSTVFDSHFSALVLFVGDRKGFWAVKGTVTTIPKSLFFETVLTASN